MLESWLSLMQQCPRHFRLSRGVVQALTDYALPAAGAGSGAACHGAPSAAHLKSQRLALHAGALDSSHGAA